MTTTKFRRSFLILLVGGISIAFLAMIRTFLMTILMAALFTAVSRGLFRRLTRLMRGREAPAAIATLLVLLAVVVVPLLVVLGAVANEARRVNETILPGVQDLINQPSQLDEWLRLLPGYRRMQGVVTRPDETREVAELLADPALRMVNRNRGAGTRVLIDRLLGGRRPPGFAYEPRSHFAVAAAVAQKRADWGVTIEPVARQAGLRFRPLQAEHYDLVVPGDRWEKPAVQALRRLMGPQSPLRRRLAALGFES